MHRIILSLALATIALAIYSTPPISADDTPQSTQPATRPRHRPPTATSPSTTQSVTVTLDQTHPLPTTAGYFVINAKVTVGAKSFPMSAGILLPTSYFSSTQPFPLVMTLHTAGIKGLGGGGLTAEGLGMMFVKDATDSRDHSVPVTQPAWPRDHPQFIGLAPECPNGMTLENDPMPAVIAAWAQGLSHAYRIDLDRVYLTGFSYGGTCTWEIAAKQPDTFAAIAPFSARVPPNPTLTIQRTQNMGIYMAVGESDTTFRPLAVQMHNLLLQAGRSDVPLVIVPKGSHWAYGNVYADPNFWTWLLSCHRPQTPKT